jgi:hypothetical protein
MCSNDLEGIVAKRLDDPYEPRVRWLKIKNVDYSQKEGRGDLFNGPRQRGDKCAVFVVEPFAIGRAIVLVVVTAAIGYGIGIIGAVLWNGLQTR